MSFTKAILPFFFTLYGRPIRTNHSLFGFKPASNIITMKVGIVLFIVSFGFSALNAQTDLGSSLGKGDVAGISSHLGDKVELCIGEKEELLPKTDAVNRLRDFYATHVAKGFKAMHSGNSKTNESNYTIGELLTDKGSFRVYIYFTQVGGKRVVAELRIEH